MIHVIDELHLNDFKDVKCPKGRDLFKKVIKSSPNESFVSSDEPIQMFGDKVSQLEDLYAYDAYMQSRSTSEGGGTDAESSGKQGDDSSDDKDDEDG